MKVNKASKDTKARLFVVTAGQHTWIIGEPDGNGLRTIQFNGVDEGKGVLLGSVIPIALGYMTQSPDIEVGRQLGVEFPERPEWERVQISTLVTAVMTKEEVTTKQGGNNK